jgi:putative spermidine/putrescine transport system permease protein
VAEVSAFSGNPAIGGVADPILPEAITGAPSETPDAPRLRRERGRPRTWRLAILILMAIFYAVPLLASVKFSFIDQSGGYGFGNYTAIFKSGALRSSLYLSLEIAAITAVLVVVLILPTVVLVRLRLPKMVVVMDIITILPIVVPPIVIAAGLDEMQSSSPQWVINVFFNHPRTTLVPIYTILAMPLVYRAIDNGVRAIDLHTLVDASRSLGSGWISTLLRVILPNVQTAVLGGMFLTIAMVLGEVVIANQLAYYTLPPQMLLVAEGQNTPGIAVALTLIALLFTFTLLFSLTFLSRHQKRAGTPPRVRFFAMPRRTSTR